MLTPREVGMLAAGGEHLAEKAPLHNLFGQRGPRCPTCSGLGRYLVLAEGATTRHTSRCTCGGTGIDDKAVMRGQIETLVDRLERLERKRLADARRMNRRLRELGMNRDPRMMNSRQYWAECIAWATADGAAIANTTNESIIFPNIVTAGNYMQDGRVMRGRAYGKYSTTGAPTGTWAVRWNGVGGTLLATSEVLTLGNGVTNANWAMEFHIQTRTNGSAGALFVMGELTVHTAAGTVLANVFGVSGWDAPAQVGSLDLTADTPLSVTFDWGTANAANTLTGHLYTLESLN
jgi:hypothetical protein